MNIFKLLLSVVALWMVSCASRKDLLYMQNLDSLSKNKIVAEDTISFNAPKIQIDDKLLINITSIDAKTVKPFNGYVNSYTEDDRTSVSPLLQLYLVDQNGQINLPQIGKITVTTMSRIELETSLIEKIKPLVPDVKVNVQLINFRVTLLGEVTKPGEYAIKGDKVTLLQAIGMAGDLTIYGKRTNIKVVRHEGNKVQYYNVDITSSDFIKSPVYYLRQNDVVYVEPNQPRMNNSQASTTTSYIISATGLLITILSILTR